MRADIARILVPIPHAAKQIGCVADEPAVGIGVGGACFACHGHDLFQREIACRAALHHVFKQSCHNVRRFLAENALSVREIGEDAVAIFIIDLGVGDGFVINAAVCSLHLN